MIGEPRAIDAGEGAVWVAEQSPVGPDNLVEIDPHTATVVGRLPVPEGINDIRAANGAVWVLGRHKPDADQGQRGDAPADRDASPWAATPSGSTSRRATCGSPTTATTR